MLASLVDIIPIFKYVSESFACPKFHSKVAMMRIHGEKICNKISIMEASWQPCPVKVSRISLPAIISTATIVSFQLCRGRQPMVI